MNNSKALQQFLIVVMGYNYCLMMTTQMLYYFVAFSACLSVCLFVCLSVCAFVLLVSLLVSLVKSHLFKTLSIQCTHLPVLLN